VQVIILSAITDVDMIFATEVIMVLITQTGVVCLMFLPKVLAIRKGEGDMINTGFGSSGSVSKERADKPEGIRGRNPFMAMRVPTTTRLPSPANKKEKTMGSAATVSILRSMDRVYVPIWYSNI
jgi:hypothetical protein